jgi:hypothetical protein
MRPDLAECVILVHVWAPLPYRPIVGVALVREFRYVYGSVTPKSGTLNYMVSEKMNTENMNKFLTQVKK